MGVEILDITVIEVEPNDLLGEHGRVQSVSVMAGGIVLDVAPMWFDIEIVNGQELRSPVWGEVVEQTYKSASTPIRVICGAPVPPVRNPLYPAR